MCISYPGRVVAFDGPDALVEVTGRTRRASTLLVPDAAIGDFVIVGAGAILRRVDAAEADALTLALDAAARTAARRSNPSRGGPR